MRILIIAMVIGIFSIFLFSAHVSGAGTIPSWIRDTARWWSEGQVSDSEFISAMEYLIDQNIIKISSHSSKTDSIMLPSVTTDKRTYQVGDDIRVIGKGFGNGTIGLIVGNDRFGVFLDRSPNLFAGSQMSQFGNMMKYPIPNPALQPGQWRTMNFSSYGSALESVVQSGNDGTWSTVLKNSNLTAGHYEIRVGQKTYNGYDLVSNSSQTFLLKVAKTDFFIR